MGILFDHSQNSEYVPSTHSTQGDYVSVMSPSSTAASWPTSDGLGSIPDSERALYGKKFRLDRSSDSDYAPPLSKRTVKAMGSKVDIPMTLENGKDMEDSGMGNSKWAVIPETQETLPESVGYTQSKSQNEAMLEELAKINTPEAVPAIEDDTPMMDNKGGMMETRMEIRRERVEKRILDLLEEVDELKDRIVDPEVELKCRPEKIIEVSKETKPAMPIPTPTTKKGKGKSTEKTGEECLVTAVRLVKPAYKHGIAAGPSTAITYSKVAANASGIKEFSIVRRRKRFEKKKPVTVVET